MNIKLLISFLLSTVLLSQNHVSAQSFCRNTGAFTITPSEGCAPLRVSLSSQMTNAESITYAYNFDRSREGPPDQRDWSYDSSYVYNLPGTYTIVQFGSAAGTGFSQCKDVIVFENRGPKAEITACQDGLVQLNIENDSITTAYDFVTVDWGDGTQQLVTPSQGSSIDLQHSFPAGTPRPDIKITGGYNNDKCKSTIRTTTLSSQSPSQSLKGIRIRSVEMLPSGDAKILYEGMAGIPTEIMIDKGDGQFVSTGKSGQTAGPQSATISGLDPNQVYSFRLSSKDLCENLIESPVVSSMAIRDGAFSLDEIISITWQHLPNTEKLLEYQLKRDGSVIFSSTDQLFYVDKDVKCGTTYQYEIVAIIENDVRSYSAPFSVAPKTSVPAVVSQANVSVQDANTITTTVEITGEGLTSNYDLIVQRAVQGSSDFVQVSPPSNGSLQYIDTDVSTDAHSYCYRFEYQNSCNLRSPAFSQPVCSILLTNSASQIVWTDELPFTGFLGGYELMELDESGNVLQTITKQTLVSHNLDFGSETEFSFRVEAQSSDGKFVSTSNVLHITREPVLLIPDAFTPNGDAYNERFEVKAYFISNFRMSVFNRWGEVVFHSESASEGWDGKVDNEKADGGYYLYKIEAIDTAGKAISKSGSFLLIR
jgi:gliding motility-associated-like protein